MSQPLIGISSMATRPLLTELVALCRTASNVEVQIEFAGGVDVARRVATGEPFDLVFLASDAMQGLANAGHVLADSVRAMADSSVAIAVPANTAHPDISSEQALRDAVQAAARIGVSTGPSGDAVLRLFERWGLAQALDARIVKPPPGVPVAELLAAGKVDLGFQQRSELLGRVGIQLVGSMPPGMEINTTFVGAVAATRRNVGRSREVLGILAGASSAPLLERHGLNPPQGA